eukprot:75770_1
MVMTNFRTAFALLALSVSTDMAFAQRLVDRGDTRQSPRNGARVENFISTLKSMKQFTAMQALVENTGVVDEIIKSNRNATIFVPTDFAFRRLSAESLKKLGEQSKENQQSIVGYHVLPDQVLTLDQLLSSTPKEYTMLNGEEATIDERELNIPLRQLVNKEVLRKIRTNARGGTLEVELAQINNATILMGDIPFENGVIHAIDSVLIPPSIASSILSGSDSTSKADNATNSNE